LGDRSAEDEQDVFCFLFFEQRDEAWDEGVVRSGKNAEADAVYVFFDGRLDDAFRGFTETGVEHFHAGIAEGAGDDLGAAVVAVEAGFGYEYADGAGWGCWGHLAEW